MELTILFFLLYFGTVVAIGVFSSKKQTEDDFMIAERKIRGGQLAATISAGFFDGTALAIYLAYVYQYGFSGIWLFVGIFLGFLVFRRFVGRIKRKADELGVYSMSEYFYRILGKRNGLMFSAFLVVQFFFYLVINFILSGKVLSSIFPLPYFIAVMIGGGIILTYLLLAGFKAVVRTDFFQLIIMIIMTFTVASFLFGKTTITSADLNLVTIGIGNIIGFLLIGGMGIMVAPDLWQRMFAADGERELKKGLGYAGVILIVLAAVISVLGLAAKQFFPNIVPEDALVMGFSHLLPSGLKQFGMVLLYAVALSSSDTVTFVISSIFTRDLKNYTVKYSEKSMKKMTRFFMIGLVTVAIIIAIFYRSILTLGLSLASLNLALFPVMFGSVYWMLKEKAVFWSLVLAFISVIILFVSQQLSPQSAALSLPVALFSLLIFQKLFKARLVLNI